MTTLNKLVKIGLGSGLSGLSGLALTGLAGLPVRVDVIEANMNYTWMESYFTYNGPEGVDSLDELKFFEC